MCRTWIAALCVAGLTALAAPADALETFNYTGTVDSWTVSTTGIYQIDGWGAQGGGRGGMGAHVGGTVSLTAGETFVVVVGGAGLSGVDAYGGGGGTWLFSLGASQPLLVAGGGGGQSWSFLNLAGGDGIVSQGDGSGGLGSDGGGGAGWFQWGTDGGPPPNFASGDLPIGTGGEGRASFEGGHTVGCRNSDVRQCADRVTGGFGGGGGGGWDYGGGGGGYTGGNAPTGASMGGTSYLFPFSFTNGIGESGVRSGNGLLTINFMGVPEPATWATMLMGFAGLGALLRRRRAVGAPADIRSPARSQCVLVAQRRL